MFVVPEPVNGSKTQSPGAVKSLMNHSGRAFGNVAEWLLFAHSVAKWRTLDGYAMSRPIQLAIFLPKPLCTLELSRRLSVSLKFLSRAKRQSPIGTITASWNILNLRDLAKCRHRSHESRKRFGHLPGWQLRLCQMYSSVQSQPCFRKARISSRT